jgi:hypothetical protein
VLRHVGPTHLPSALPAMLAQFPPRPFLGPFIVRVCVLWTFVRAAAVIGGRALAAMMGWPAPTFPGSLWLAGFVVSVVTLLTLFDMARRSELLFLANLGQSSTQLGTAAIGLCVMFEALIRVSVG